jgi:hypothetical protein
MTCRLKNGWTVELGEPCSHAHSLAGGPAKAKKVWKPTSTAASYRYFVRGTTEKPSKDDIKISQPGMRRLAPYDHMLRHFQCDLFLPYFPTLMPAASKGLAGTPSQMSVDPEQAVLGVTAEPRSSRRKV